MFDTFESVCSVFGHDVNTSSSVSSSSASGEFTLRWRAPGVTPREDRGRTPQWERSRKADSQDPLRPPHRAAMRPLPSRTTALRSGSRRQSPAQRSLLPPPLLRASKPAPAPCPEAAPPAPVVLAILYVVISRMHAHDSEWQCCRAMLWCIPVHMPRVPRLWPLGALRLGPRR